MTETQTGTPGAETPQQQLAIRRVFVRDLSFESPRAPDVFNEQYRPQVHLDINVGNKALEQDHYEVRLKLTVKASSEAGETFFMIELEQCGIFLIKGLDQNTMAQVLNIYCPNVLFPYARETIDSLALKGSFPPLQLNQINFEAMFAQAVQQQREGATAAPDAQH